MRRIDTMDGEGRRDIEEVTAEREIVARIHALRSEGRSLRAICDALAAEGRRTKRGRSHWSPKVVRSILQRSAA